MTTPKITIVGRSSSHYTRVVRIFAHELGVAYAFTPVLDILSLDASVFAGNPALKVPVLVSEAGSLFGSENICREIVRLSGKASGVVSRGQVNDRLVANGEELVLHVMSAEVTLIMAKVGGGAAPPKLMRSIDASLRYLDDHLEEILAALPEGRALSFFEVTLFCLVTHLPFREVLDVAPYARLQAFTKSFGTRESARATEYKFDVQA